MRGRSRASILLGVMDAPRRILFVCTGNICRSAMAEHLLRHRARRLGLDIEVASCGVAAEGWYRMPGAARRQLEARGVPFLEHKPRLAARELLRWADLVLVMAAAHRDHLADQYPEFNRKVKLLREYAGFGPEDVADPMGRPEGVYAEAMSVIEQALDALLDSGFRPVPPRT